MAKLEREINHGIQLYGIYRHPEFGPIYAYETDGFGNYCLMDDAGTPGLISIPYLGYVDGDDPIYENTRRFALSKENPFYYEGTAAKGIGSPHTPPGYIWHMALVDARADGRDGRGEARHDRGLGSDGRRYRLYARRLPFGRSGRSSRANGSLGRTACSRSWSIKR